MASFNKEEIVNSKSGSGKGINKLLLSLSHASNYTSFAPDTIIY